MNLYYRFLSLFNIILLILLAHQNKKYKYKNYRINKHNYNQTGGRCDKYIHRAQKGANRSTSSSTAAGVLRHSSITLIKDILGVGNSFVHAYHAYFFSMWFRANSPQDAIQCHRTSASQTTFRVKIQKKIYEACDVREAQKGHNFQKVYSNGTLTDMLNFFLNLKT